MKNLDKLEEKLQRDINYKFYSLTEFKKNVKDKDPFMLEILKDEKILIRGDENELRAISES